MGIDPFTAQIGASVIGGVMGKKGADAQAEAQDKATAAQMAGFNQYKPYVDANLSGASGALDGVLATGAYTGPTYAGPNAFQTGTATNMGNIGGNLQTSGYGMMNSNAGFGANANSLYNQFQGLSQDAQRDRMASANQYAINNMDPLVTAAMRDDRRMLEESTLPGVDLAASGTGNMNSSRAGVAEAVANRAFNDRRADVSSQIMDSLRTQSLNQQNQQFVDQSNALTNAGNANTAISNAYNTGMNTLGEGANFGMNAGNTLQGYDQAALNDTRSAFERQRDFELQQRRDYQAGVLGKAPSSPSVTPNFYNGAQGAMSGAMQGFGFANQYFPQQESVAPETSLRPRMRSFGGI